MNTVLARFGLPTHPVDAYRYFVGDGIDSLVGRALPADHRDNETIRNCLSSVKKEYAKRWNKNTKPYPGIAGLLSTLQHRRIPMTILSNKPDHFTQLTVAKLLHNWSFQIIRGVKPSVPQKPDPTAALQIAAELAIPPRNFLYLGDTNTDMKTASAAGMYPVGALWGFRDAAELLESGAKALAKSPLQILDFFA